MAHEATIRNLDQEQSRLKEKINRLEEERGALLNQSQAANEQHKQHVLKLEQVRPARRPSRSSLRSGGGSWRIKTKPTLFLLLFLLLSPCARSTRVMRKSCPG